MKHLIYEQRRRNERQNNKSFARISAVAEKLDGEQMCWVMMLLTLPKLNAMIMQGEEYKKFADMRRTIN